VARGTETRLLRHLAWNGTLSVVLTGEDASFDGVVPAHRFDASEGYLGAFELAVRATSLHVDSNTFPAFADESKSARNAYELAAGLNWFPTSNLKIVTDYARTTFQGGAPLGGARATENVVLLRTQFAY